MIWSAVLLIFFTLTLGIAGWLVFLWAVKSGQFDDIEGPKYRIFDDEDTQERCEKKELTQPHV